METEGSMKEYCRKGSENGQAEQGRNKECLKCPYAVQDKPRNGRGIGRHACGIRPGQVQGMANLGSLKKCLNDTEGLVDLDGCPSAKKVMLEQLKHHAKKTGWTIKGFSKKDTIVWLDMLLEFSQFAEQIILDSGHGDNEVKRDAKNKICSVSGPNRRFRQKKTGKENHRNKRA